MRPAASLVAVALLTFALARGARAEGGWFPKHRGPSLKVAAGGAYRQIYSVPMGAADVSFALGAQTAAGAFYGVAGGLFGSTEHGLAMRQLRLGASWEAPLDRLHVGLAPRFTFLTLDRATTDGEMGGAGFGCAGFVSYDLIAGETYAVYGVAEVVFDVYEPGDDVPVLFGGTIGAGARFF